MAASIIFVSLSGGDNPAELQRLLLTFRICISVVRHSSNSFGFIIFLSQRTLLAVGLLLCPFAYFLATIFTVLVILICRAVSVRVLTLLTWE
jgi:hypothetical protein